MKKDTTMRQKGTKLTKEREKAMIVQWTHIEERNDESKERSKQLHKLIK